LIAGLKSKIISSAFKASLEFNSEEEDMEPEISREFLQSMTINQLVEFAGENGLRARRRPKRELVEYIFHNVESEQNSS